jgi:hypothetical protein
VTEHLAGLGLDELQAWCLNLGAEWPACRLLISRGYTRQSKRHVLSKGMSGIFTGD